MIQEGRESKWVSRLRTLYYGARYREPSACEKATVTKRRQSSSFMISSQTYSQLLHKFVEHASQFCLGYMALTHDAPSCGLLVQFHRSTKYLMIFSRLSIQYQLFILALINFHCCCARNLCHLLPYEREDRVKTKSRDR